MTSSPAPREVVFLTNEVHWFGTHTGFQRLPHLLDPTQIRARIVSPKRDLPSRMLGKAFSMMRGHGVQPQDHAFARARAELALHLDHRRWAHLIYGELHMDYWRDAPATILDRTLVSAHQPPSHWGQASARKLDSYRHLHVLWQKDMDWFQSHLTHGEITFIHHGVDTEFFTPASTPPPHPPFRLLYAGVHLRNVAMLKRVVLALCEQRKDIEFDFLVPEDRRTEPELADLQGHPRVTWHARLNDEQLRELYRRAFLLVLPLNDSGANTAVIEALSCGLPLVTTDVGGIRDYGGGTLYPVVANNNDDAMIGLVENYLAKPAQRQITSENCRAFAETTLAWPLILEQHLAHYRRLMG